MRRLIGAEALMISKLQDCAGIVEFTYAIL